MVAAAAPATAVHAHPTRMSKTIFVNLFQCHENVFTVAVTIIVPLAQFMFVPAFLFFLALYASFFATIK